MTEFRAVRNMNRCPTHPGALLSEIVPATGKSKVELANLLGISRQQLYDILNERKPVSPSIAARLGKLFGDGAAVWLAMQSAYDAWHAERDVDVSGIPTIRAA
jgi:antitoxin HigA-1